MRKLHEESLFSFAGPLLVFGAITLWLTLPGVSSNASSVVSTTQRQERAIPQLDLRRLEALAGLQDDLHRGASFAEEERAILRRFAEGQSISELEADLLISRALYDRFIAEKPLDKEQHELLERYTQSIARRGQDVADRKIESLKMRQAAAAASPPRMTLLAAPANDICAGAEVISGAGPFPYLTAVTADITDATTSGDPPLPSCQTSVSRSIWYSFTPTATATYTVSSCADGPTGTTVDDTVIAIYTSSGGCLGPFVELPISGDTFGCDDDSCASEAFQAVITTRLNSGTQYFIVVWEFGSAAPTAGNTAVQLRVSQVLPPSNDTCASATAITLNTPTAGTTVAASNDYQLSGSSCFTGIGQTASTASGHDVVFSFTAPAAGNYSFRVTGYDPNSNLVVYVASTCPSGTPPITISSCLAAANRDASSTSEEIKCLSLATGQNVFLFVDENSTTEGSSFTVEVTRCDQESEPNDTPGTATAVTLPVLGIEGSIATGSDVDFYSLGTVAANSRVFAVVDGVAAGSKDFDLRVTTSVDTLEFDDLDNDAQFGSLSPNVEGTPTPNSAVPLYLRVNNAAGAAEPYRLYAVVQPPGNNPSCNCSATNENEPNNTAAQANTSLGNYFYGALAGPAPSTDVDLYRFTTQAGALVFLGLDGDPTRNNTPIDAQLELLDSSGAALMLVNDPHFSSSTTPSPGTLTGTTPFSPGEALVYRVRTGGTYYARVSIGTSSSTSIGAGDYLLSIAVFTPNAPTPQYLGFLDGAGCNTIQGWAWDANNPNSTVFVDIYDGNTLIGTVPADMYREDLLNSLGSPNHGFSFLTPASLKDGAAHTINVRFSGTSTLLSNTGRPIQCTQPPSYYGRHDGQGCNAIEGWAWDGSEPNATVNVDIYDGSTLITTIAATLYRQDLVSLGNPYHGWIFHTPPSLRDGQPHTITVKFGGTNINLPLDTPRTTSCTSSTPNLQGNLDSADCNFISGYAWDANDDQGTVVVAIYVDGAVFVVVAAQDAYPGVGTGYHGFKFAVPASLKNGQPHSIMVRFSGTTTSLMNSPRNINCSSG